MVTRCKEIECVDNGVNFVNENFTYIIQNMKTNMFGVPKLTLYTVYYLVFKYDKHIVSWCSEHPKDKTDTKLKKVNINDERLFSWRLK